MKIIDLKTKTMKENGKFLIKNGIPQNGYTLDKTKVTWEELEKAYEEYKHSVPNGVKYHHKYFKGTGRNRTYYRRPYHRSQSRKSQRKTGMDAFNRHLERKSCMAG